ncbi:MAG: DnaD domain protein [Clostridia bacterium]|nr:DnaD domain protein [Clostridia bacterium]
MKIDPKYKDGIIALPSSQVLDNLKSASGNDLKVLVYSISKRDATAEEIADAAGITKDEVKDSLAFWKSVGAVSVTGLKGARASLPAKEDDAEKDKKEKKELTVSLISYGIPVYTEAEIAKKLRSNKKLKTLVDECCSILGKILNTHEVGVIVVLSDYLMLGDEYIMLLCSHCAAAGKTSLQYVKRVAENLVNEGITEYSELERYYENIEGAKSTEGYVRRLFGTGSRALTPNEKKCIALWNEWNVSQELIKAAYDISVDNTGDAKMNYMHKVISNWYENGITTPEGAAEASRKYKDGAASRGKGKKAKDAGSFDTDDFFEAAIKRSYSDKNN